jgi:hypothetical protein
MRPTGIDITFVYSMERIETDENFNLKVAGEYLEEGYLDIHSIVHNGSVFDATDTERERITVYAQEHYSFNDLSCERTNHLAGC